MSMCKGGTESKLKDSHFMSHLPNLEPFRKETTKLGRILQESEREKKNCRNLGRTKSVPIYCSKPGGETGNQIWH